MNRKRVSGLALGITGGIACGKSEVGRILTRRGVPVLDADDVAHRLLQPGTAVHRRVIRAFGPGVVGSGGSIDRTRLGAVIFADGKARERLNRIVHPAVRRERDRWLADMRHRHAAVAVIVPLLFEVGATKDWDAVICVAARRADMIARLRKRGHTATEAVRRIRAQWPLKRKIERSDYVIWNLGTRRELERATLRTLNIILRKEKDQHV